MIESLVERERERRRTWLDEHRELVYAQNRARAAELAGRTPDPETLRILEDWNREKQAKREATRRRRLGRVKPETLRTPAEWWAMIAERVTPAYQVWVACVVMWRQSDHPHFPQDWSSFRAEHCQGRIPELLSFEVLVAEAAKIGVEVRSVEGTPRVVRHRKESEDRRRGVPRDVTIWDNRWVM